MLCIHVIYAYITCSFCVRSVRLGACRDGDGGVAGDADPPSADKPTGLTVASFSHDSVTLSWDDPGDSSITGYQVQRSGPGSDSFTTIEDNTGLANTATMTVSISAEVTGEGTLYKYSGFATGTPDTIGSMSATTITGGSSTFWGCPDGGCSNGTVTELYYVTTGSKTSLVFRPGLKIPDGFTLTIGDNSYDLADSGYFVTDKHKYGAFPVGPTMHFWYDVGNPGLDSGDTPTVTLDRPVYQAPTYDDVLNDVDWQARMTTGDQRETVKIQGPDYQYLVRGYGRSIRNGSLRLSGTDRSTISANSKQYKILDFNIVHDDNSSFLEFRVEGGRLGNDATVNIDGRSYRVTDAAWSPVYGTHTWPTHFTLARPLGSGFVDVSITSN